MISNTRQMKGRNSYSGEPAFLLLQAAPFTGFGVLDQFVPVVRWPSFLNGIASGLLRFFLKNVSFTPINFAASAG